MSTTLVYGYSGIGAAVAEQLHAQGDDIIIVSRQTLTDLPYTCIHEDALEQTLQSGIPDVVINTAGILHTAEHGPEKNIQQLDAAWLNENIQANVMPTVRLAQLFTKHMSRDSKLRFVSLSARVSSISDNHLGGWYSYRMSKAALNMLIKNLSIEWQRQFPLVTIVGYHPGTVDTALSEPFQTNVPPNQLFSPEQAATYLLQVLGNLQPEDSGKLLDWQGKVIPY